MAMARLLHLLDLRNLVPLQHRLDAVASLARHVESACSSPTAPPSNELEHQLAICYRVLVSSLLRAPEELGDAIMQCLSTMLHGGPCCTRAKLLLLQLADSEVQTHHAHWRPAALLSLLSAVLNDNDAGAVANAFCERTPLVDALVQCIGFANGESEHEAQVAALSMQIFSRVVQKHGAAPSAILARCDVKVAHLTVLLTHRPPRAPPHPPVELLELLTQLGRDPSLAPLICTPALLSTLRSSLLCGSPPLQHAGVELCAAVEAAGADCGRDLLQENVSSSKQESPSEPHTHDDTNRTDPEPYSAALHLQSRIVFSNGKTLIYHSSQVEGVLLELLRESPASRQPAHALPPSDALAARGSCSRPPESEAVDRRGRTALRRAVCDLLVRLLGTPRPNAGT